MCNYFLEFVHSGLTKRQEWLLLKFLQSDISLAGEKRSSEMNFAPKTSWQWNYIDYEMLINKHIILHSIFNHIHMQFPAGDQ